MTIRVIALRYRVIPGTGVDFNRAPPLSFDWPMFNGHLERDILTLTLKDPVGSIEHARAMAEPRLHAWELSAGIGYRSATEFRLRYLDAETVDDASSHVMHLHDQVQVSDSAVPFSSRGRYPDPPDVDDVSPEAEAVWTRVGRYIQGEETLLSVAYFCFTVLKREGESKTQTASRLKISSRVLDALSHLSSTRGDITSARKMSSQLRPLTSQEEQWLDLALLEIARHLLHRRPSDESWLELQPPPIGAAPQ